MAIDERDDGVAARPWNYVALPDDETLAQICQAERDGCPLLRGDPARRAAQGPQVQPRCRVMEMLRDALAQFREVFDGELGAERSMEARLRLGASIIEHTSEAVIVTDANRRIVAVNPAFTTITGFGADEVLGRGPQMLRSGRHHAGFYRAMLESLARTGCWRGQIWGRRKDGEPFLEWLTINIIRAKSGAICHYVGIFSDISNQEQIQARLHRLAWYDVLTDLPNRQLFLDRLAMALQPGPRAQGLVALFYIDLDRFKDVNKGLGHGLGDRLLIHVAGLLADLLRSSDTVARIGGDEFTLILRDLKQPTDALRLARRVLQTLVSCPFVQDGHELFVTASIGIALYPLDAKEPEGLLRCAEAAMHRAKESGRNGYCAYSAEMTASSDDRLALEADLRRAMERGELSLEFQPRIALSDFRVVGCEALLRWNCGRRGRVAPGHFIPLAEETGLIVPLGRWVIDQALQQAHQWRSRFTRGLRVAINVSAVQLREAHADTLFNRLGALGLPDYGAIELELTESVLMDQSERISTALRQARDLGIEISIDDFGTGYSSLGYLKCFPIDSLKIDASFVRDVEHDPSDAAIATAVIAIGHALGLKVVAEGVETPGQLAFLKAQGCDEAQGFLFSRPLAAGDMTTLLATDRPLWAPH